MSESENSLRLIYGRNPIREALTAGDGRVKSLYAAKGQDKIGRQLLSLARQKGVQLTNCSKAKLFEMTQIKQHQGFAAYCKSIKTLDLLGTIKNSDKPLKILAISQVHDPGNLGAVIRNCEHCGVDLLVLAVKGSCSVQLASVAKSSAGAVEHMPIALSDDLVHDIHRLKDQDVECLGLDMHTSEDLMQLARPTGHRLIVLGSEGFGLSGPIQAALHRLVKIQASGRVNSLNLSSASMVAITKMCLIDDDQTND